MILRNKFIYAWSDLRRRGSAKTVAASVFLAALVMLLVTFYGLGARRYMARSVSSDLLARVAVDLPTGKAAAVGELDTLLKGWQERDAVAGAWPRIEITADAVAGTSRMPSVSVEGVDSRDPVLAPDHLAWGAGWPSDSRAAAVVSQRSLLQLGGRLTADGPSIRRFRLELRREVEDRTDREAVELEICGVLADTARPGGARDTLLVPLVLTQQLDRWLTRRSSVLERVSAAEHFATFPRGATLYARQDRRELLTSDLEALRVAARPLAPLEVPELSGPAWVGISGPGAWPAEEVRRASWGVSQQLTSLVPVQVAAGVKVLVAGVEATDPRWVAGGSNDKHYVLRGEAPIEHVDWLDASRCADGVTPSGIGADAVMTISDLAARHWRRDENPSRYWRRDFLMEDAYELQALMRHAEASGWSTQELSPVEQVSLESYSLEDLETGSAALSADLVVDIAKARASVFAVVPNCSAAISVRGVARQAVGTTPNDPRRFRGSTIYGRWVRAGSPREVVLPLAWRDPHALVTGAEGWVGAVVSLEVSQANGGSVAVPFKVVGFTAEEDAFLHVEDVQRLNACAAGALVFDPKLDRFVDPSREMVGGGAQRATVVTTGVEGLREFIAHVEPAGYVVHHRLSELERAREFGDTIALYALALAAFAVAMGALMSWNVTRVYLKSKVREVGILRSLGLAPGEIGKIFGLQGLMLGAPAFALALVVAVVLEPLLSDVIGPSLGASSGEAFAGRLLSLSNTPIHALGGVASVGLGVLASFWVATSAAKRPLADSLKAVE